jgi:hypothetical protein
MKTASMHQKHPPANVAVAVFMAVPFPVLGVNVISRGGLANTPAQSSRSRGSAPRKMLRKGVSVRYLMASPRYMGMYVGNTGSDWEKSGE